MGQTWEEEGSGLEWEILYKRREKYNCEVPNDVICLTAGIETQDDRFEIEVVGWGVDKESWGKGAWGNFFSKKFPQGLILFEIDSPAGAGATACTVPRDLYEYLGLTEEQGQRLAVSFRLIFHCSSLRTLDIISYYAVGRAPRTAENHLKNPSKARY